MSYWEETVNAIIMAGHRLDAMGLAPATSGNYSHKQEDDTIAVTVSGRHKGRLTSDDIMRIDTQGRSLEDKLPSAEALLHSTIYQLYPEAKAILHTHSVESVVLSRFIKEDFLRLSDYEMLKAFPFVKSHDIILDIPIFDNTQNMEILAEAMRKRLESHLRVFIIRGHGIYVWGQDMTEAERLIEAMEYLLSCEIETIKLQGKNT